jgi:hypothetical protein
MRDPPLLLVLLAGVVPAPPLSLHIHTCSLYTYLQTTVRCTFVNMLWASVNLSIHSAGIREKATREREAGAESADEEEDTCISTVFACAGKWQALPSEPISFTSARQIE